MPTYDALEIARPDPLFCNLDLPFRRLFHPAGFRLHLATNEREVMDAAEECWRDYGLEFPCEPIQIRLVVQEEGGQANRPRFRLQRHLLSIVSDAHNFAVADLDSLLACIYVSKCTAADYTLLRWFFLESIAYTLLAQRYVVPLHAASVARNGSGILLCGRAGTAKRPAAHRRRLAQGSRLL